MEVDRHMEQEGQNQRTALEDRNRSRCDSRPARCRRPRPRFRACDPRCVDVRRAAADGTRPRVFRAFQFWGRRVHLPKQRGVSFPQPAHETSTNINTNPAPAASYAPSYSSHSNTSSPASYAGPSGNSNYGGSSASLSNCSASLTSYLSPSSAHAYTSAASSPSNAYNTTSTPYASTPYSTSSSASVHSTPAYPCARRTCTGRYTNGIHRARRVRMKSVSPSHLHLPSSILWSFCVSSFY
ncbi:hypothetical protein B0H14DRAFT_2736572, partial [Mycena olivaceomarginata]